MHSKCENLYNDTTEGPNTPMLMTSQYVGDQSKMESSHHNYLGQTQQF